MGLAADRACSHACLPAALPGIRPRGWLLPGHELPCRPPAHVPTLRGARVWRTGGPHGGAGHEAVILQEHGHAAGVCVGGGGVCETVLQEHGHAAGPESVVKGPWLGKKTQTLNPKP